MADVLSVTFRLDCAREIDIGQVVLTMTKKLRKIVNGTGDSVSKKY